MDVYASHGTRHLLARGPSSSQRKYPSFLTHGERVKLSLVSFLVPSARNVREFESTSPTCVFAQLLDAICGQEFKAKEGIPAHKLVIVLLLFGLRSSSIAPIMTSEAVSNQVKICLSFTTPAAIKVALNSLSQAALPPQSATFSLIRRLTNPCL